MIWTTAVFIFKTGKLTNSQYKQEARSEQQNLKKIAMV